MKTLLTLILFGLATACQAANLTIPTSHPRLWFGNGARLAQAQARFATNPFTPAGGDIQYERALRGVLTANVGDCDLAADYLVAWLVENNGSRRDALRQQGEELLLIYDWCHDRFTPAANQHAGGALERLHGHRDQRRFRQPGFGGQQLLIGRTRNRCCGVSPASTRTPAPRSSSTSRSTPATAPGFRPGTRTSAAAACSPRAATTAWSACPIR